MHSMDEFWTVIGGTVCIHMNSHTVPTYSAHTGNHTLSNGLCNQFHPNNVLWLAWQPSLFDTCTSADI